MKPRGAPSTIRSLAHKCVCIEKAPGVGRQERCLIVNEGMVPQFYAIFKTRTAEINCRVQGGGAQETDNGYYYPVRSIWPNEKDEFDGTLSRRPH